MTKNAAKKENDKYYAGTYSCLSGLPPCFAYLPFFGITHDHTGTKPQPGASHVYSLATTIDLYSKVVSRETGCCWCCCVAQMLLRNRSPSCRHIQLLVASVSSLRALALFRVGMRPHWDEAAAWYIACVLTHCHNAACVC